MRWAIWIVLGIVALVGLVAAIGWQLPKAHTATRRTRVNLPPDALFALLADVDHYPAWRPDVKRIERVSDQAGRIAWVEETSSGRVPFVFERMERPSLLVSRIADRSLPFGGTWTYRITPADGGSELAITEDGEVYNPIFRFVSRFIFGHTATMDTFIRHLQVRAGQEARG